MTPVTSSEQFEDARTSHIYILGILRLCKVVFHSSLSSDFGSVRDVSEAGHDAEKPPAIEAIEVNDSEEEQHVTEA